MPSSSNANRIIVMAGLPGSGKTTTAKKLKTDHNFVYFEGDAWSWADDAVAQAEDTPTPELIAKARANKPKMAAVTKMGAEFYAKVQANKEEPNYEAAYEFYDLMMADVVKASTENPGKDIVVVHAIHHAKVREHLLLSKKHGQPLEIVCLDVPREALKQRNLQRLEARAKEEGTTLPEFVSKHFSAPGFPAAYPEKLATLTDPGQQRVDALTEEETKTKRVHLVSVAAQDDPAMVHKKVLAVLGLARR